MPIKEDMVIINFRCSRSCKLRFFMFNSNVEKECWIFCNLLGWTGFLEY
jgi:hypothetical protein